jgi:hypothetical protein
VQLHDLGAVDQTLTAVGHQVLRLIPTGQRRRPPLGPAQIEDLLACLDHRAVDDPGDDHRNLARRDGDHGLVEQRHALSGLTQPDRSLPPAKPGESHQIQVAETLADLGRLTEGRIRARGVPLRQGLERDRYQQIPLLHAVVLAGFEQPPHPTQPAATTGQLALDQETESQPEPAPGGSHLIAQAQALLIPTAPDVGAVAIPADQVSRRRQPLKIRRLQRCLVIRQRELGIAVRPGVMREGVPPQLKDLRPGHALSHWRNRRRECPARSARRASRNVPQALPSTSSIRQLRAVMRTGLSGYVLDGSAAWYSMVNDWAVWLAA